MCIIACNQKLFLGNTKIQFRLLFKEITGHKMVHKNIFQITALAAALALAGCGGESGYFGNVESDIESIKVLSISEIELEDASGDTLQTLNLMGATAKVTVKDSAGKVVTGALVNFSSTGGVEFGSTNGSVLTNANGEAIISVKPIDSTDTGTYQLSATVEHNGITVETKPYNFSLQATNIVLNNLLLETDKLDSGSSTNITLKTQDSISQLYQNNISVDFTATCGSFEPATVVSSNQGDVTTSYKAIGSDGKLCAGTQTITVQGSNIKESKSISVDIAQIHANSLIYTSKEKLNLGIRRSGSASSGQIEFTLYANGIPAANQDINIELLRAPEDLSFLTFNNRQKKTIKSDSSGKVIVTLYPGDKPGPVEIKATLATNSNVFAISKNVSVSIGRVTQSGLSLAVSKNALQGSMDGDTATITARMVDRTGNPVPDGTVISFVSEGGKVDSNCSSINGGCSVTLTTQDPRPLDNRTTVLAYVEGDKDYIDMDGDNLYTAGIDKLIHNIGSFFRDDNENNRYDNNFGIGEFLYNRVIQGSQQSCAASMLKQPNIDDTCDDRLDAVLRQQLIFAFADDVPTVSGIQNGGSVSRSGFSFELYGNSLRTVPMPSGTTVSVEAIDNTQDDSSNAASGVAAVSSSCEAEIVAGHLTVPNVMSLWTPSTFSSNSKDVGYKVQMKGCSRGDEIKVNIQSPITLRTFRMRVI